jgi:prepilin-type N-terminal cleavage/methylation domain-containing protein
MKTVIKKGKIIKRKGFTLIELLVAMFIFAMVLVAMMAVFNAALGAYQKGRAVKKVMEDAQFALNSVAKDVRMGKIESADFTASPPNSELIVTRNRNQTKVCYRITTITLDLCENAGSNCNSCSAGYKSLVDLSGTGMSFASTSSGFRNQKTFPVPPATPTSRGWVEINLNIAMTAGEEMNADSINVQTIVSSRDYGW